MSPPCLGDHRYSSSLPVKISTPSSLNAISFPSNDTWHCQVVNWSCFWKYLNYLYTVTVLARHQVTTRMTANVQRLTISFMSCLDGIRWQLSTADSLLPLDSATVVTQCSVHFQQKGFNLRWTDAQLSRGNVVSWVCYQISLRQKRVYWFQWSKHIGDIEGSRSRQLWCVIWLVKVLKSD